MKKLVAASLLAATALMTPPTYAHADCNQMAMGAWDYWLCIAFSYPTPDNSYSGGGDW